MNTASRIHPDIESAIKRVAAKLVKQGKAASQELAEFQVIAEIEHASFDTLTGLVTDIRAGGRTWPEIAAHSDGSNPEAVQRRFSGDKPRRVNRERFTLTGARAYGLTEAMKLTGLQRSTIQLHIDRDREQRIANGAIGPTWWIDLPIVRAGQERLTAHVIDLAWLLKNVKRKPRKRQGEV